MTRLRVALGLLVLFGVVQVACGYCDDPSKVKTGNYVLAPDGSGAARGYEWLVGSEMAIDREAGTATLRYEREGTVYDVEFELVE
jgi:hypothetical protein